MASKNNRKLIMLNKQPIISLPSDWVKYWDMKKGDLIPIVYNSILIVIPPNHPKKKELDQKIREVLV